MYKNIDVDEKTAKLYQWINTWRQKNGAYNGWVVHRYDLKRLKEIHDTPWEQSAIINGLLNLYENTKNKKYLREAEQAVRLQISRLDMSTGKYNYAGFEDDRFSSLVHNALADCAILEYAKIIKGRKSDLYNQIIETVISNFQKYLFGVLWNEEIKAFKFSEVDYYSRNQDRYVANMNSVAVEAMIKLYLLEDDEFYRDKALQVGEWLKTQVHYSDDYLDGAIVYSDVLPDIFVNIYTALALRGIDDLYQLTGDKEYGKIMIKAAEHLLKYTENDFFCHAAVNGIKHKKPYFVAGAGIILKAIDDTNRLMNTNYDLSRFVKKILSYQQPLGGIQSFVGYNSKDNHRKKGTNQWEVWEDYAPGVPWNAHIFEFLSRYVSEDFNETVQCNTTKRITRSYLYYENRDKFFVVSLFPLRSSTVILINKRKNRSILSFSLIEIYRKLKKVK